MVSPTLILILIDFVKTTQEAQLSVGNDKPLPFPGMKHCHSHPHSDIQEGDSLLVRSIFVVVKSKQCGDPGPGLRVKGGR